MQNVETGRAGSRRGYRWKKWLAIYLVAGAVVYAIVYFAFLNGGGGHTGGGGGGYAFVPLPLVESARYLRSRFTRR